MNRTKLTNKKRQAEVNRETKETTKRNIEYVIQISDPGDGKSRTNCSKVKKFTGFFYTYDIQNEINKQIVNLLI